MRKQFTTTALLIALAFTARTVQGQVQQDGPSPEQMQIIQKFQDMQAKVMSNMQQKGIDPQAYFQEIFQKIQTGALDPADMQQDLLDKGIIDQASIDDIQQSVEKMTMNTLQHELNATDEEWAVLSPKIKALVIAQAGVGQAGQGGGRMGIGMGMGQVVKPAVTKALRALRAAVRDPATPSDTLAVKIKDYRDAKAAANADLAAAQKDLIDLLTLSQEATLVRLGMIP